VEYSVRNSYVLHALAGQVMTVEVSSATHTAIFEISGLQDKIMYKALEVPPHATTLTLPTTQDYLVTVTSANNGATSYVLTITIVTPGPPCTSVAADIFYAHIQTLNPTDRLDFQCPSTLAQSISGQYLEFERGFMLQVAGRPEIYVWYNVDPHWNSLLSDWQEGQPNVGSVIPPGAANLYQPERVFGRLWERDNLRELLGFALAAAPTTFAGSQQDFNGGTLIANQENGKIFTFSNRLKR
jgi:hypothetical protein